MAGPLLLQRNIVITATTAEGGRSLSTDEREAVKAAFQRAASKDQVDAARDLHQAAHALQRASRLSFKLRIADIIVA